MQLLRALGLSVGAIFAACEPATLQTIPPSMGPTAPTPVFPDAGPTPDGGGQFPPGPDPGVVDAGPQVPSQDLTQLANGIRISSVSAFQPLEVPLLPPSQPNAEAVPLIFNKEIAIRVGVELLPGFAPRPIKLEVNASTMATPLELTQMVTTSSSDNNLASYLTVEIPANQVVAGLQVSARLLGAVPGAGAAQNTAAMWPPAGQQPIALVQGAALDLVLVPVNNTNDPQAGNFNLTPERVALYRETFLNMLPLDPNRTTVRAHATHTTSQPIDDSNYGYFSRILDDLAALHEREGLPATTAMYGLLSYGEQASAACTECPAGLANGYTVFDPYRRPASFDDGTVGRPVSVGFHMNSADPRRTVNQILTEEHGWTDDDHREADQMAAQQRGITDPELVSGFASIFERMIEDTSYHSTAVHEVLHTLGYDHVRSDQDIEPPATDDDYRFPYTDGGIGRMARDPKTDLYLHPSFVRDVMSYASDPTWVSDFNYRLVLDAMSFGLSGMRTLQARPKSAHYRALVALNQGVIRRGTITSTTQAASASREGRDIVILHPRDAAGRRMEPVAGRLLPFSQARTGHLLIPEVENAATYEIRRWGTTVTIDVPSRIQ